MEAATVISGGVASATLPGRECDCGDEAHLKQCAHWDGQTLRLCGDCEDVNWFRVSLVWTVAKQEKMCTCGSPISFYNWKDGNYNDFTDYSSALAAFYQAELKLLGREE